MSRGRPSIDPEMCKGCALCVEACPEGILAMSQNRFNGQGLPFAECRDQEKCTACLSCAIICPDAAICIYRTQMAAGE
jgi:2-oxoglutarate ferredoxin oxidoreductase subunit delta